jgi:hypothetical protein
MVYHQKNNNEMKTPPLTTSFPKSKGNNLEIDQIVNPKNQENPEIFW